MEPEKHTPSHDSILLFALKVGGLHFLPWLAAVLAVTLAGFPGVICITPLAWLLALRVGLRTVSASSSSSHLPQAALAGAFLGLLQGLLFLMISPRLGPLNYDEALPAALLIGAVFVIGMAVGAGLAGCSAYLGERRRAQVFREENPPR